MTAEILTVRELTERIRRVVEGDFPFVWVGGEVTNLARPSSGHVYFSLKDGDALLQCVWFRGRQRPQEAFDPLTGEVFEDGPRPSFALALRDGLKCVCAGRLSVYAPRGGYQLLVDFAQESGRGELYRALEQLKRKLEAKGYFRLERKRPLPEHPFRVAVITAPTGAAIRDFLRLAGERGCGAEIRLYPAPVQGDEAPARLCRALEKANADAWAEVIVLIRGGGSLEDLWAFNDERVADAVFASAIPVLAGIGHEVDTSVVDMVADKRAATPSHAAQLLWHERRWYAQVADEAELALIRAVHTRLEAWEARLDGLTKCLTWFSPQHALERIEQRRTELVRRLSVALEHCLGAKEWRLEALESAVRRGIEPGRFGQAAERVSGLERRLLPAVESTCDKVEALLRELSGRLERARQSRLDALSRTLERVEWRLESLDPYAPLARGYAMAVTEKGVFVRSVQQLTPGTAFRLRVTDGSADAVVTAVKPEEETPCE